MSMHAMPTRTSQLLSLSALTLLGGVIITHGCSTQQTDVENNNIETCTSINTLINSHRNQFAAIRHSPRPYKSLTVWQTNYEVIKNHCEIWGWGQGNYNYVCSIIAPNQEVAQSHYDDSIKRIQSCLSDNWTADNWTTTEQPRKIGEGVRTRFLKKDKTTAISVHLVKTPGLFKSEWTTYASVGNYSDDI